MPRPSRDPRVFDASGTEVFITLVCTHCHLAKPLKKFGLRRMGDGTIRNAPWCKACRGAPRETGRRIEHRGASAAAIASAQAKLALHGILVEPEAA